MGVLCVISGVVFPLGQAMLINMVFLAFFFAVKYAEGSWTVSYTHLDVYKRQGSDRCQPGKNIEEKHGTLRAGLEPHAQCGAARLG